MESYGFKALTKNIKKGLLSTFVFSFLIISLALFIHFLLNFDFNHLITKHYLENKPHLFIFIILILFLSSFAFSLNSLIIKSFFKWFKIDKKYLFLSFLFLFFYYFTMLSNSSYLLFVYLDDHGFFITTIESFLNSLLSSFSSFFLINVIFEYKKLSGKIKLLTFSSFLLSFLSSLCFICILPFLSFLAPLASLIFLNSFELKFISLILFIYLFLLIKNFYEKQKNTNKEKRFLNFEI